MWPNINVLKRKTLYSHAENFYFVVSRQYNHKTYYDDEKKTFFFKRFPDNTNH